MHQTESTKQNAKQNAKQDAKQDTKQNIKQNIKQDTKQKETYHADLYLRLSREDGDKAESDSITNQRELLLEFLKNRDDIQIHAVRIDDGYSGINFERPAFQKMLRDIQDGKVNCVVTKDLSRFGRNHTEAGKYIDRIFPAMGVRFIAVNDHYDSLKCDMQAAHILIPFQNLVNDAYCRDISMKIRSHLEIKRKRGEFVLSLIHI